MASVLNAPHFQDETAAYAKLESLVWPNGPVCPHCGGTERVKRMGGKSTRPGLHKCYDCRKQCRVTVGTVFESSHVPLHIWLQAAYLLCSSKKGISSNQLARTLGVTVKTGWFIGSFPVDSRECLQKTIVFHFFAQVLRYLQDEISYYSRLHL